MGSTQALSDHVGGGGHQGHTPLGPISFIFMQFSAKMLPNNTFLPQIQGLAHRRLK